MHPMKRLGAITSALLLLCMSLPSPVQSATGANLAKQLGFRPDDKILIVNGDDAGMCHTANLATIEAMEKGLMRSATIMVPCPWFPEMAAYARANPDKAFGIHLTHTSEWIKFRWGPVASRDQVPGLLDPDGYLWKEVEQVYANAKPDEALLEGRAQIRKALKAGVEVTHIDSHMGTLQLNPEFMKVYLQLAVEFDLPARMASQETLAKMGHPNLRTQFTDKGILFPDYFIYEELKQEKQDVKKFWLGIVQALKPGITELYIHAGMPTDELKAISGSWSVRSQEFEVFTNDQDMKQAIAEGNIKLISYKPIRELQRKLRAQSSK